MKTLYRATRVYALGHLPPGEWLLVDGRHVQRVGSGDPPEADRVIELPGTTILPGMIDSHVHLSSTGAAARNEDVASVGSADELVALARDRASRTEGAVVALQGFDESRWGDVAFPSWEELESISERPVVIRRADGHLALVNAAAIQGAAIAQVQGVARDEEGVPTGVVTEEANAAVGRWVAAERSANEIEELQLAGAATAASRGVTTVHQMAMPHDEGWEDLEVFLGHRRRLPVDALPIVSSMDVPRVIDLGLHTIGGDLPADGSIGARTAALAVPYEGGDGQGSLYYEGDELAEFFHNGHAAGLQVGMHAIGDRAIDQVITAWERVYAALDSRERRHFRARRHRIEHFEVVSPSLIERAAMLGLAASVQPAFDALWGRGEGLYASALGLQRAGAMNPFRSMLERGLVVGAGSDAPVTPLDPWLAVEALERHHEDAERLDRAAAIRIHTAGSALLGHQEDKKGILAPGAHADFAAYEDDPFDAADVAGLRPVLTVSLGREVYAA